MSARRAKEDSLGRNISFVNSRRQSWVGENFEAARCLLFGTRRKDESVVVGKGDVDVLCLFPSYVSLTPGESPVRHICHKETYLSARTHCDESIRCACKARVDTTCTESHVALFTLQATAIDDLERHHNPIAFLQKKCNASADLFNDSHVLVSCHSNQSIPYVHMGLLGR